MSRCREVLSGAPAGTTAWTFKDFMFAWLTKMKRPAANFNFLMTQRAMNNIYIGFEFVMALGYYIAKPIQRRQKKILFKFIGAS